jgi:hypothetical protein
MYALIDISNQMLEDRAFDPAGVSLGRPPNDTPATLRGPEVLP